MYLISQGLYSLFCVAGFSIIFNLPRRLIPLASISGMLGWLVYIIMRETATSFIIPAFIGSILIGLLGELAAIYKKQPATIFIIPGIIPLVPGYGIYYTMFHVIDNNFSQALVTGGESLFISISIACGVVIATSVIRYVRPYIESKFY